ncbi:hypothetical protein AAC387_Pa03g0986 [Persea americana]
MSHHQHQETAEVDVSGLMLLADVMIESERMENIFESFPKRQRTRNRPSSSLKVDSLHNSLNGPVLNSQSQLQVEPSKKKKRPIETNDDIDGQKPRQSISNCLNGPLTSQRQPEPSKKGRVSRPMMMIMTMNISLGNLSPTKR